MQGQFIYAGMTGAIVALNYTVLLELMDRFGIVYQKDVFEKVNAIFAHMKEWYYDKSQEVE